MRVERVSNEYALAFLRENAKNEYIFIRDADIFFGVFDNHKLVSVTGIRERNNRIFIESSYTLPAFRNNGMMTEIYEYIIATYKVDICGYFNARNQSIPKKLGF